MIMDTYSEQLVIKRRTGSDKLKAVLISAGAVILASFVMFLAIALKFFSLVIPVVLILFGAIWYLGNLNIEYEYIITNNEMDVDKIIGRRKRKRMITLDLSKAEDFDKYPSNAKVEADVTVKAFSGSDEDAHYLLVKHGDYGTVNLIFNPNDKTREAILQEIPRVLRAKIVQNGK